MPEERTAGRPLGRLQPDAPPRRSVAGRLADLAFGPGGRPPRARAPPSSWAARGARRGAGRAVPRLLRGGGLRLASEPAKGPPPPIRAGRQRLTGRRGWTCGNRPGKGEPRPRERLTSRALGPGRLRGGPTAPGLAGKHALPRRSAAELATPGRAGRRARGRTAQRPSRATSRARRRR